MESQIRLAIFVAIFAIIAILEFVLPRRKLRENRWRRWGINFGLIAIDVIVQRLTLGAAAYGAALYAQSHGWGLFSLVEWPFWLEGLIAFVLLDFAIYLQHVLSHALPVFWRLHRVHHADLDLDLTSGLRFHPVEILISLVYKSLIVLALGIDPWIVVLFEAVLNGSAIFSHGNFRLPEKLDNTLRWVICTPDMHRIHHSVVVAETNSNYGFFLSIWDRLCGTWRQAPAAGQLGMTIGLAEEQDQNRLGLAAILLLPFRKNIGDADFGKDRPDQGA